MRVVSCLVTAASCCQQHDHEGLWCYVGFVALSRY
jgi:hypothetical protein